MIPKCPLLIVGTPMAWWLARTRSPAKPLLAEVGIAVPRGTLCDTADQAEKLEPQPQVVVAFGLRMTN